MKIDVIRPREQFLPGLSDDGESYVSSFVDQRVIVRVTPGFSIGRWFIRLGRSRQIRVAA